MALNFDVLLMFTKISDLITAKRDSIMEAIDRKSGNIARDNIKQFINDLTDVVINEVNDIKNNTNITPTNINNDNDVLSVSQTNANLNECLSTQSINLSQIKHKFTELSTDDKINELFAKVIDLSEKVDKNSEFVQKFNSSSKPNYFYQRNDNQRKTPNKRQYSNYFRNYANRGYYSNNNYRNNNYRDTSYRNSYRDNNYRDINYRNNNYRDNNYRDNNYRDNYRGNNNRDNNYRDSNFRNYYPINTHNGQNSSQPNNNYFLDQNVNSQFNPYFKRRQKYNT